MEFLNRLAPPQDHFCSVTCVRGGRKIDRFFFSPFFSSLILSSYRGDTRLYVLVVRHPDLTIIITL